MTDYVACDISEWQPPVNDTYPHRWLSFRACDGDYVDKNAAQNLTWAVNARRTGKLDGFTVYVVYRPGKNALILQALDRLGVPADCVVMVDAETWNGQITGDHSAELNSLAASLATRQKSQQRVWGYGNRSDLAALWPGRPSWLGVVIASYGGSNPNAPGQVGWQYTDGTWNVPGLPSSSPPFGPCDHNVFTPSVAPAPTPTPAKDTDMVELVQYANGGPVYVSTNRVVQRHVANPGERDWFKSTFGVTVEVTQHSIGVFGVYTGDPQYDPHTLYPNHP